MQMSDYVTEVTYALEQLVPSLWHESYEEAALHERFHQLEAATQAGYRQSAAIAMDSEDAEDVGLATAIHWDTYFGVDKQRHATGVALKDAVKERLRVRRFSLDTLSGSVLQIVKQGLSVVHGGLTTAPGGRLVGQQALSTVVWQARNQSMHWEESKLSAPVLDCFLKLEADFGAQFSKPTSRSLAFQVVAALGWQETKNVLNDLTSLA